MLVSVNALVVDAAETVVGDAYIRASSDAAEKSWQRVLVGSLADSSGYFARNITDLDHTGLGADPAEAAFWIFTDDELGETRGKPRLALTNAPDDDGGNEWAAVVGGGYNNGTGATRLFVVFIDRGMDGWSSRDFVKVPAGAQELAVEDSEPVPPNGLSEVALVDVDLDGTADLAYAGDLFGNLYRFDIAAADPSRWYAVRLFQAAYGGRAAARQPITRRPFAVAHPQGQGFLVVFATGSGYTEVDRADTNVQSIYGIWDTGASSPATARSGARNERLVKRTLVNLVDESGGSYVWRRVLTGGAVNYALDAPGRTGVYGWYIDLDMPRAGRTLQGNLNPDSCGQSPPDPQYPGERAVGRLVPRGATLFVATAIPSGWQGCASAPPGSLLAIDAITGGSPRRPVLDANGDGRIGSGDMVVYQGASGGPGIVFGSGDISRPPGELGLLINADGAPVLVVGNGDDSVSLHVGATAASRTGRLSWRELSESPP